MIPCRVIGLWNLTHSLTLTRWLSILPPLASALLRRLIRVSVVLYLEVWCCVLYWVRRMSWMSKGEELEDGGGGKLGSPIRQSIPTDVHKVCYILYLNRSLAEFPVCGSGFGLSESAPTMQMACEISRLGYEIYVEIYDGHLPSQLYITNFHHCLNIKNGAVVKWLWRLLDKTTVPEAKWACGMRWETWSSNPSWAIIFFIFFKKNKNTFFNYFYL